MLDLFAGSRRFARACLRRGAEWVLCYDTAADPLLDLLQPGVRREVEELMDVGACYAVAGGPTCASFSTAHCPRIRTPQYPKGVPWAAPHVKRKLREGNSHSAWCAKLISKARSLNIRAWIENPDGGWMWRQREWQRLFKSGLPQCRVDMCRFGAFWRKRTRFATTIGELTGLTLLCLHNHPFQFYYREKWSEHMVLRGFTPWGQARTNMAEPYPLALADMLAAATVGDHGLPAKRFDASRFAEAGVRRCHDKWKSGKEQLGAPSRPAPGA